MDRRAFIRWLTMTGLLSSSVLKPVHANKPKERILIVGAGMAGIAAAIDLQNAGREVTVLEGRNRIGGRIWTSQQWSSAPLDMGAAWVHGVRGNPLTKIADAINAPRMATDYDNAIGFDQQGKPLTDKDWMQIEGYFNKALTAIKGAERNSRDISVARAVENYIPASKLSLEEKKRLHFMLNSFIEHEFAADVSQLSAHHLNEGSEFRGGDVLFTKGYFSLINHLAMGLDIRLNQRVKGVNYGSGGVEVVSDNGVYHSDRVIITVPIGVLKEEDIRFHPRLPESKRQAIASLGAGLLNKLYLRFPSVFWSRDAEWIHFLPHEKGAFTSWLNIYRYTGQPILLAFNAGTYAREIEALSDEDQQSMAMQILRRSYGQEIAEPESIQLSRWQADPLARCSYSYPALDMDRRTRHSLALPVASRLFFAGEATASNFPSTVHGAYLSGRRVAKQIIRARS